jgi:hypothetical protein
LGELRKIGVAEALRESKGLRSAVVVTFSVGHANGGHQCDAWRSAAEGGEHISHAATVNTLTGSFTASVGSVREDDRVHAIDGGRQRTGTCQVADDDLDIGDEVCLSSIAHEDPYGVVLPGRFLYNETPNAASGTNDQYSHAWDAHARGFHYLATVLVTAAMAFVAFGQPA